ncbi:helix-turn-helix domain-containing protein [Chryseobacterium salivictor]|uniref:HTH-type transcriptional activator RhaR n=1 Tax=Chryseobacterium salivictor TaxID=2547600 RepID=A0A4P6ZHI3_9FLAO|nr:AraC family transcriptional regulator [Chryseobacterium salivictor]QBO59163.1 HTH-type transcriptional activator RhaR [Chryseobacterium salivictor]
MKINIKNMVCDRCISAVNTLFVELKIPVSNLELGEIETVNVLLQAELKILNEHLKKQGFEILENAVKTQTEHIKKIIILKIADLDIDEDFILSKFISAHFAKDYSLLSKTFSTHENFTLEQYFILQKIEKAKELLLYNEFTLTEISQKLGYKSVQHLSAQFKNCTGFNPTSFKKLKSKNRIALDQV